MPGAGQEETRTWVPLELPSLSICSEYTVMLGAQVYAFFFFLMYSFIYLAASGLSCHMQDLHCCVWVSVIVVQASLPC